MSDHHWTGVTPEPEKYFGFVYLIEHESTGRKYIGRKNYWLKNASTKTRKCKSATPDRGSDKWKSECWRESDWATYKGSSKNVRTAMKKDPEGWTYTILRNCRSRGVLTYCEVREQWDRKVLEAKLPDGTYEYMNRQIGAIKFRPPEAWSDESKVKFSEIRKNDERNTQMLKELSENQKGVPLTEEHKKNLKKARKKRVYTPEHCEAISKGQKARWARRKHEQSNN